MSARAAAVLATILLLSACSASIGGGPVASPASRAGVGLASVPPATAAPSRGSAATTDPSPSATTTRHAGWFAFGPDGALYVTDCGTSTSGGMVLAMDTVDTAHPVAGDPIEFARAAAPFGDGGPAPQASIGCATGIAFDRDGRLLIADHNHNRIRRIESDGTITTIAGLASPPVSNGGSFSGDGGPAVDATLNAPVGLTVDAVGRLYIADRENDRVRRVDLDGTITDRRREWR